VNNYTREDVEDLLWLFWDVDRYLGPGRTGAEPDGDMPRAKANPSKQGTWMAELADMKWTWQRAGLTRVEAQRLCKFYGAGRSVTQISTEERVAKPSVHQTLNSGLEKLTTTINKRRAWL
jgi:hypothetical protein